MEAEEKEVFTSKVLQSFVEAQKEMIRFGKSHRMETSKKERE